MKPIVKALLLLVTGAAMAITSQTRLMTRFDDQCSGGDECWARCEQATSGFCAVATCCGNGQCIWAAIGDPPPPPCAQ
jgi:hypothetical protein